MVETNTTRRRVLQGAGAIGIATLGSTTISAQETDAEGSSIRVVHASPDAPDVDVRLSTASSGGMTTSNETSDGAATSGENETAGNATAGGANETTGNETAGAENASDNTTVGGANESGNETAGGENESDGGGILSGGILGGNESDGGSQTGSGQAGGEGPSIEGLGFGDVSSYTEVEPGSYQVEIVSTEDESTVLDAQIDVEEETTYTVVAYGEVASSQLPVEDVQTDSGTTGTETGGVGGNETETDVGGNETETDTGVGGNETETETGGTSTTAQGSELVSSLSFGEYQTVDLQAEDYTLVFEESTAAGTDSATDSGLGETETETESGGISGNDTETESGGIGGNETEESGGIGNESNDSAVGGNETETESGGIGGNETETETETGGTDTTDSEITSQEGGSERGFQVQVLEDDLSDPGDDSARLRVFHAVPDVDALSISRQGSTSSAGGANETTTEAGGMNETTTEAGGMNETTTEAGGMNETTTEAGGTNETVTTDGGVTTEEDGAGTTSGQQTSGQTADFSAEANTAYSGFAMGYFDPQAAGSAESESNASAEGGMAETETETGGIGNESDAGNESDTGMNETETETEDAGLGGNESDAENESGAGMTETETETSASVAQDEQPEEFQFVTAEDAQDGERSEGGSSGSGGGLL